MKGEISEEALQKYSQLAAESLGLDFSESGDTYDFTRCVRPDGSAYGTRGKCRKGTEGAAAAQPQEEKKAKPEAGVATAKKPRASTSELRTQQKALFDAAKQHRAEAKAAEKAHKENERRHKGSKSPEARKSLMETGRAWDQANSKADRTQRAWMKAHERWRKAAERENRAKMSSA